MLGIGVTLGLDHAAEVNQCRIFRAIGNVLAFAQIERHHQKQSKVAEAEQLEEIPQRRPRFCSAKASSASFSSTLRSQFTSLPSDTLPTFLVQHDPAVNFTNGNLRQPLTMTTPTQAMPGVRRIQGAMRGANQV